MAITNTTTIVIDEPVRARLVKAGYGYFWTIFVQSLETEQTYEVDLQEAWRSILPPRTKIATFELTGDYEAQEQADWQAAQSGRLSRAQHTDRMAVRALPQVNANARAIFPQIRDEDISDVGAFPDEWL